nr:formate C-acetyltransferase/glycerol dehydratase family glycyl radical enzyme [Breznakibacter sp.]
EHVYEKKDISFSNLMKALKHDFVGFDSLRLRLLYETAKYGNDDDFADQQAADLFKIYFDAINGRPTSRGGVHRINLLPTTCHIYFGEVLGAMPDGRKAGEPVSEGISPVQGADRQGPTAVVNTMSKLDHLRTGGTLLNMKFTPSFFKGEKSKQQMTALIRSYFYRDGHHIQFNVVDAQTLRQAQANPERFADLIVRVAGYSDYFNDLTPQLQDEIIKRTEHDFNIN